MYCICMATQRHTPTVGALVWRLSLKWRAAVDRAVAPLGLTHGQYSLLGSLQGLAEVGLQPSQRELADHTGLEPLHVSKLVRALEREGLVERTANPNDTRAVLLRPTTRGPRSSRRPSPSSATCSTSSPHHSAAGRASRRAP